MGISADERPGRSRELGSPGRWRRGLALQAGWTLVAAKLLIVGLLIFFTSPAATHALAKAALGRGLQPLLGPREGPSKP
jgi:multicomponent Na+:H+ antiporter subunit G